MSKTRLMDKAADYEKLGINAGPVEIWEDGKREDSRPGAFEWWYFDAVMDDGTKIVIYYSDKYLDQLLLQGPFPYVELQITLPDGTYYHEFAKESDWINPTDSCNVQIGPHKLSGDLKEYQVLVSPINGAGVNLKMTNISTPWRPATGYFAFGENEDQYFTWLCAVPRGKVDGTITINGEEKHVSGYAYHDHQWGNVHPNIAWNHWTWARQNFGEYNLLLFDFVATKLYGGNRYTICLVQDNDGNIVFENYTPAKYEVIKEYTQEETGKQHPAQMKYTFENGNDTIEYTLAMEKELEVRVDAKLIDDELFAMLDQMGLYPSYTRYYGNGKLTMSGSKNLDLSGNLIYEFVYSGKNYW